MVPLFQEMITTLQGAQNALRPEMEQLTRAGCADLAALQRLGEIGRSFQEQAHSLLVMMLYQDAPGDLIREAEDPLSFFSEARRQLDGVQMASQRAS